MPPMASWASKDRPLGPNVRSAPNADRDGGRERDAGPDDPHEIAALGLDEVGDEDADDERRLEAFAQSDQVVGEHDGGRLPIWAARPMPGGWCHGGRGFG